MEYLKWIPYIWNTIIILVVIIIIYINLLKPLKTFNDYWRRSNIYSFFHIWDKSIRIINEAINRIDLTDKEEAMCLLFIGNLYFMKNNYFEAIKYFDKGLQIALKQKLYYGEIFRNIIKCYIETDHKDKAISLYKNLIERQKYDKNFRKLRKIEKWLGE